MLALIASIPGSMTEFREEIVAFTFWGIATSVCVAVRANFPIGSVLFLATITAFAVSMGTAHLLVFFEMESSSAQRIGLFSGVIVWLLFCIVAALAYHVSELREKKSLRS